MITMSMDLSILRLRLFKMQINRTVRRVRGDCSSLKLFSALTELGTKQKKRTGAESINLVQVEHLHQIQQTGHPLAVRS